MLLETPKWGRFLICQMEMALPMVNILEMKDPQPYEVRDDLKNPADYEKRERISIGFFHI